MPMLWKKTKYICREGQQTGLGSPLLIASWVWATFSIWCQEWLVWRPLDDWWRHPPPRGQTSAFHTKAESYMEGVLEHPRRSHKTTNETPGKKKWCHGANSMNMTACWCTGLSQQAQQMKGTHANSAMRLAHVSLPHAIVSQGLPSGCLKLGQWEGWFLG